MSLSPSPAPVLGPGADTERALLLACLWAQFDEDATRTVRRLAEGGMDMDRFLALARQHRLHAVAVHALHASGAALSEAARDSLDAAATEASMDGLRMAHALVRVVGLLEEAGVRPVALKGPAMAAALYGDVALRPSGDLDLLIAPEEHARASAALVAAGYRPEPGMTRAKERAFLREGFAYGFYDEGGVKVDLHVSLVHRAFGFAPDHEAIRQRAVEVTLAGRAVRVLAPEDLVLFLCVHGAKHEWRQLVWVCDVAQFLRAYPGLDWPAVLEAAERTHALRMLALGLFLACGLTRVWLPLPAAPLIVDPVLPALAREALAQMGAPAHADPGFLRRFRFHVGVREHWADRLRQAAESARLLMRPSDKDRAFVALPAGWRWLYYLVRPFRLLTELVAGRPATRVA